MEQAQWRRRDLGARAALEGYEAKKLRDLHFDALIALTARAIGAVVITCNRADFEVLRNKERFDLAIWNARAHA